MMVHKTACVMHDLRPGDVTKGHAHYRLLTFTSLGKYCWELYKASDGLTYRLVLQGLGEKTIEAALDAYEKLRGVPRMADSSRLLELADRVGKMRLCLDVQRNCGYPGAVEDTKRLQSEYDARVQAFKDYLAQMLD